MKMKWVRAKDGVFFGVCKGLARTFEVQVGALRLAWLVSVLFMGAGLGLYLLLAICLPREDKLTEAMQPWFLGVCAKISRRIEVEVGIVRLLAIILGFMSLGASLIGYIVLYFVLDDRPKNQSSESNPSTPPATT
jgi:phage shock protein PspC (stress-responsive transcriptional regulator)